MLIFFSWTIAQEKMVSFKNGNKWFYHRKYTERIGVDETTKCDSIVKEIVGEKEFWGKIFKKVKVIPSDTVKNKVTYEYWLIDTNKAYIQRSLYGYDYQFSNDKLVYDEDIKKDTSWKAAFQFDIGSFALKLGKYEVFDKTHNSQTVSVSWHNPASPVWPSESTIFVKHLGIVYRSNRRAVHSGVGKSYTYTSFLYGAILDGEVYGSTYFSSVDEGVITKDDVVEKFYLNQNYPNPFNPSTTIAFSLRKEGVVSLKVYNLLGKLIKTVFSKKEFDPSSYTCKINMSEFTSGVYIYKLTVDGNSKSRKMLYLK
ncbi:MAG: T9SS type A sorting domain-containing protein [Bacteroidales bacterium]